MDKLQALRPVFLVFLGGGLGSIARFALSTWIISRLGSSFPFGTLTVNILGCLVIGLFIGLPSGLDSLHPTLKWACITGFLGGFTTFSAYEAESFLLILQGDFLKAGFNLGVSMILGLASVAFGMLLSRFFLFRVQ